MLVNLDCDIILPPSFAESVLSKFRRQLCSCWLAEGSSPGRDSHDRAMATCWLVDLLITHVRHSQPGAAPASACGPGKSGKGSFIPAKAVKAKVAFITLQPGLPKPKTTSPPKARTSPPKPKTGSTAKASALLIANASRVPVKSACTSRVMMMMRMMNMMMKLHHLPGGRESKLCHRRGDRRKPSAYRGTKSSEHRRVCDPASSEYLRLEPMLDSPKKVCLWK